MLTSELSDHFGWTLGNRLHMLSLRGVVKAIALPLAAIVASVSGAEALAQDTRSPLSLHDRDQRGTDLRLPALRESSTVEQHTIGIAFDGGSNLQKALLELDDEVAFHGGLRLVPSASESPLQSLYDLLFLKGVDAAIIRSDVVEFVARHGGYTSVRNVVNTMARLRRDKLVLVSSNEITSLDGLQGKVISLGERSSSAHLTGAVLLAAAGIEAQHRYLPSEEALEQLDSGEIDAMLHLIPYPGGDTASGSSSQTGFANQQEASLVLSGADAHSTAALANAEPLETARVLPIEISPELARVYTPSTLSSDDLPGLIDRGTLVNTLSVDTILAAYRWRPETARHADMTSFTEAFIKGLEHLQAEKSSPFWTGVALNAEVRGVVQLPMVDTAIATLASEAAAASEASKALARQTRVNGLKNKRELILSRMREKASSANDKELQRLLDELDDFLKALEQ